MEGLARRFGDTSAVDGLTLSVERGEIFGLVGPDGAGKTTTMRLLAAILDPTGGDAWILGHSVRGDAAEVHQRIGYMSQRFGLYADLTVLENLHFYADLYGVPRRDRAARIDGLFAFSGLGPFRRRLAGNLSGGMKQKLVLACALVHEPELMILDEPTTGIDPLSRREFWGILTDYLAHGKTIVYSTVYLEEALRSNRIALMDSGRIKVCDTPENLLARVRGRRFFVATDAHGQAVAALSACPLVASVQPLGSGVAFLVTDATEALGTSTAALAAAGIAAQPEPAQPTLEDVLILAGEKR